MTIEFETKVGKATVRVDAIEGIRPAQGNPTCGEVLLHSNSITTIASVIETTRRWLDALDPEDVSFGAVQKLLGPRDLEKQRLAAKPEQEDVAKENADATP